MPALFLAPPARLFVRAGHLPLKHTASPIQVFASLFTMFYTAHTHTIAGLIATLAIGLSVHMAAWAELAADKGRLLIHGQISAYTCLLDMSDSPSGSGTGSGSKTLNLGTYTVNQANAAGAWGYFGAIKTVYFRVKSADGSGKQCVLNPLAETTTYWDIGIYLRPDQYTTSTDGKVATYLLSSGSASNIAANVGVELSGTTSQSLSVLADLTGRTQHRLDQQDGPYGVLLSDVSNTSPSALVASAIALSAQFVKLGTASVTPGVFIATIPLTVWYK